MAAIDISPPVQCSILQEQAGGSLQLRGRLSGAKDLQGTYTFRVLKTSPSGTSTVNQGGPFTAPANTETLVGSTSFNMQPDTHFTATLDLKIGDQTTSCELRDGDRK